MLGVRSLNHWTTGEVPLTVFKIILYFDVITDSHAIVRTKQSDPMSFFQLAPVVKLCFGVKLSWPTSSFRPCVFCTASAWLTLGLLPLTLSPVSPSPALCVSVLSTPLSLCSGFLGALGVEGSRLWAASILPPVQVSCLLLRHLGALHGKTRTGVAVTPTSQAVGFPALRSQPRGVDGPCPWEGVPGL